MTSINYIYGTNEDDLLPGTSDDDAIFGVRGADTIDGRNGDDELFGDDGNDRISGSQGDDSVSGGNGRDRLSGGDGADVLDGGDKNDKLVGGAGDDQLSGGAGSDKFMFKVTSEGFGTDVITDLNLNGTEGGGDKDKVVVEGYGSFGDIDEFNQFAQALNDDGRDDTGATAVGDDAVLTFGSDGTIIITGGADLFTGGGAAGDDFA